MSEELRWFRVAEKEPPDDGNILIYNDGDYVFVTYLPPRRGQTYGDWDFDEYVLPIDKRDLWIAIDPLLTADAMDGKVIFLEHQKKGKE